jgi:hypothetical protein
MSSVRDKHLWMEQEEIDRLLEEALGPPPTPMPRVTTRTLDEVLSSRTHIRVLRVLVALDRKMNLTARELARRAVASHGRVLEVLRQLSSVGIVTTHRTPSHAIYCFAGEHPLAGAVRSLFDQEWQTGEDNVKDPPLT